jgi:hypothetical protein
MKKSAELRKDRETLRYKKQKQVPHRHPPKTGGWVRDDNKNKVASRRAATDKASRQFAKGANGT